MGEPALVGLPKAPGAEVVREVDESRDVGSVVPAERLARARALLQQTEVTWSRPATKEAYTVPEVLRPLLPQGLHKGSVGTVQGSSSLLLTVLGELSRQDAWIAIVGLPELGLLAASQQGVDLERLVVVPRPGPQAAGVVSSFVDGIDVVVCGPGAVLSHAQRHRLTGRVRERGCLLLSTSPWPGSSADLLVDGQRWQGLGAGTGRLRDLQMAVTRADRGAAERRLVAPWARRVG